MMASFRPSRTIYKNTEKINSDHDLVAINMPCDNALMRTNDISISPQKPTMSTEEFIQIIMQYGD